MSLIPILTYEEALAATTKSFQTWSGASWLVVDFGESVDRMKSHALRRRYLTELTGIAEKDLPLRKSGNGKPFLENSDWSFSVSHSGRWWAFACAKGFEVGIDLETWRDLPRLEKIARRVFTAEENADWSALEDDAGKAGRILTFWTRKEAYIKAKGSLLFRELSKFDSRASREGVEVSTRVSRMDFVLSLVKCPRP